jgi:type I restriction enzyme S subunit
LKSSYKRIGDYIELVDERNKELNVDLLLGLSISKQFIPSVANTVGADMSNYKIIKKGQFACSIMQVRRDGKMPIALLQDFDEAIISQAYPVFRVIDENKLLPEYLMMWFSRSEFDRQATFHAVGGVRGSLEWDDFLDFELPIPSIEKQQEIVTEYNTITNRIALNEQLNQKLEETAQGIYKNWFVDFEFPNEEGKPYKSSGGRMEYNDELDIEIPEGWESCDFKNHANIIMGQSPKGDTYNFKGIGVPLINGPVEFGSYYTEKRKWTTSPTKLSQSGDLIVCVRGSTVGKFVKSDGEYCIGRGVCSIRGKESQYFVDILYRTLRRELESLSTGSTFPSWDRELISSIITIKPAVSLIIKFENYVGKIFSVIEVNETENIKLWKIKELLLAKMVKVEVEEEIVCLQNLKP